MSRGFERSFSHLLYNAGKRSIALDLDTAAGWEVVRRVAEAVDVVIAPLDRDQNRRDFFDWLRASHAEMVTDVVDVVFRRGATDQAATDLIATAAGGLLTLNGFPEDPPNHPAGQLAYKQASLAAAEAAVALVMQTRRTGVPGWVTVSLQEAVNFTTIQSANANILHWQGRVPSRHMAINPFSTFKSKDGLWTSFTVHPPNWDRFVQWVGSELGPQGIEGAEWRDLSYRGEHRADVGAVVERLCAALEQAELLREGQSRGLLVLPVNSPSQIAADPHLLARNFFTSVHHAQLGRSVTVPRTPLLTSARTPQTQPAPGLGEHTDEVLRNVAGISLEDVDELFRSGIATGPRSSPSRSAPPLPRSPRPLDSEAASRQPLKGVRILDFGWAIAGPLSTRLLADLGADVIKVESEYRTDPIRYIGVQPPSMSSLNTNGQFNDCNTTKRALTLNLNTPEGIDVVRELAATADVVISNYTPDRLDRWGLSYESLERLSPAVMVANLAVMGTSGPHRGWRSYGNGIVAMCGLADRTGFPGREPIGLGTLHTDFTVPYFAALHVMAALVERSRTGKGQYLELSQYEASVHLLDTELIEHPTTVPSRNATVIARDRWFLTACFRDREKIVGSPLHVATTRIGSDCKPSPGSGPLSALQTDSQTRMGSSKSLPVGQAGRTPGPRPSSFRRQGSRRAPFKTFTTCSTRMTRCGRTIGRSRFGMASRR